jgi:hypothetical protein
MRFLSVDPVAASPLSFSRYWYANNNPYKYIDPDGRYICNGSKSDCDVIGDAINKISDAAKNLPKGSSERSRLDKVSAFYGKAGEKNKVTIEIRDNNGSIGGASTRFGRTTIGIQLGNVKSSWYGKGDSENNVIGGLMAHEGQHGIDQRKDGMPKDRESEKHHEVEAYTTQGIFNMGAGYRSDPWRLVGPGGGIDQDAVDRAAEASTQVWCSAGGACQ